MSLAGFQRALVDLIASPALCRSLLTSEEDAAAVLDAYALTGRERRRLTGIVGQRGMAANCAFHRANRLGPLRAFLPRTCALLGAGLRAELDAYWERHPARDLQFRREVETFAGFLLERCATGEVAIPALPEVLAAELQASGIA
ncbi:MAG TPA: hypothetical protein VFE33_04350 [Thermoanaerobaculia bacterium]|nr:hypothetical protein [Thermoanaerobaculia bacterium]